MSGDSTALTIRGGDTASRRRLQHALEQHAPTSAISRAVVIANGQPTEATLLESGALACRQAISDRLLQAAAEATQMIAGMRDTAGGRLVLILPAGDGLADSAVRGGLTSFVRSAAVAFARDGVAVNAIVGDIANDDVGELAGAASFLLSAEAAPMVGQVLP